MVEFWWVGFSGVAIQTSDVVVEEEPSSCAIK